MNEYVNKRGTKIVIESRGGLKKGGTKIFPTPPPPDRALYASSSIYFRSSRLVSRSHLRGRKRGETLHPGQNPFHSVLNQRKEVLSSRTFGGFWFSISLTPLSYCLPPSPLSPERWEVIITFVLRIMSPHLSQSIGSSAFHILSVHIFLILSLIFRIMVAADIPRALFLVRVMSGFSTPSSVSIFSTWMYTKF